MHAAHRLADRFPDGQLFASLHGHDDKPTAPAQVAVRFLAALGVPADRSADPVGSFRSAASGRRLLVLLDNAADEAQVVPLLPPSAGCLVLVTSRQALGALARVQALCLDVFGYRESVELLCRAAGPGQVRPAAEGWMLNGLGNGYWRREAYPQAIECYRQALAIRAGLGDDRGVAVVLNNLGCVYGAQRRYGEAIDCLRRALAIREKLGNELDKSFALNSLGHLQHELGHCAEALPLLTEALRIRRELGSRNGEAATLHCLGDTLTGLGRHLEALACLRAALLIFRQLGNRYGEAAAQHSIGSAWRARGRPRYAERYLRRAIAIYRDLGRCTEEAAAREELAAVPATASS